MLGLVMVLRLVGILGRRLSTAWHEVEKLEEDQRQFYSCEEFTLLRTRRQSVQNQTAPLPSSTFS